MLKNMVVKDNQMRMKFRNKIKDLKFLKISSYLNHYKYIHLKLHKKFKNHIVNMVYIDALWYLMYLVIKFYFFKKEVLVNLLQKQRNN